MISEQGCGRGGRGKNVYLFLCAFLLSVEKETPTNIWCGLCHGRCGSYPMEDPRMSGEKKRKRGVKAKLLTTPSRTHGKYCNCSRKACSSIRLERGEDSRDRMVPKYDGQGHSLSPIHTVSYRIIQAGSVYGRMCIP